MSRSRMTRRTALEVGAVLTIAGAASQQAIARRDSMQPLVEGYTDQCSYAPGDRVKLHASSAKGFTYTIVRIGATDTVVAERSVAKAESQPVPGDASSHGCKWAPVDQFQVEKEWKSGYYAIRFQSAGKVIPDSRSSAFFIVRPASGSNQRKALLQLAANTYNAYTNWGGYSLYAYNGRHKVQGRRVSFDRPLTSQFSRWEEHFVRWAEGNGYELDYAVNNDLKFHPELLDGCKLVLSVGHDEYWSAPMRNNLEKFIGNGGNVAFFSGNTCCWQVRNEEEGRALACWKQTFGDDPLYRSGKHDLLSTLWSHYLVGRPENTMTGVGFLWGGYHRSHGQFMDGPGSYTLHRPDHWMLAGTDLHRGDSFGAKLPGYKVVGYECDGCELVWKDGLPFPTHADGTPENFQVIATAPARWHPDDCEWYEKWAKGRTGNAVIGSYTRGGTVVTVGSTDWSHGLRGKDPAITRITRNVLDKLTS